MRSETGVVGVGAEPRCSVHTRALAEHPPAISGDYGRRSQ